PQRGGKRRACSPPEEGPPQAGRWAVVWRRGGRSDHGGIRRERSCGPTLERHRFHTSGSRQSIMVRIELTIALQYQVGAPGADFVFNIHGAHTRCQTVQDERLYINQALQPEIVTEGPTHNRYLRLRAQPGQLTLRYHAIIDLHHHIADPQEVAEVPVSQLPAATLPYIYPSRYCQSD